MKNYIAKEGFLSLFIVGFIFILVWIFYSFSILLFVLFLLLLFVFRIPNRSLVCTDKKAILSPIDGKVISIENVNHKDFGECIELSIENSLYNAGNIISPFCMDISEIRLKHGLFLCNEPKFKTISEKIFILAKSSNALVGLRICAGFFDRKLKLENIAYKLETGDKMGFLISGNVSLLLPKDTRLHIGLNDELRAGSLLGYLA